MHMRCGCAGCVPLGTGNPRSPSTAWPLGETPRSSISRHAPLAPRAPNPEIDRWSRSTPCGEDAPLPKEQLHLVVLGEAFYLYQLAFFNLLIAPIQLTPPRR